MDYIGANECSSVRLSQGIDEEWKVHLQGGLSGLVPFAGFWQNVPAKDLPNYLKLPQCLRVSFNYPPLGKRVFNALKNSIPIEVFGDHLPSEVILRVGPHDLLGVNPDSELFRIARPFISLTIWGYHSPPDTEKYQAAVLCDPEIQRVRKELDAIMGEVEMVISCL